jgi:8-oxo-dGTP pyrophosphatase MutT (NUDIX family)
MRGGPQRIPRPPEWREGRPAPWSSVEAIDLSLGALEAVLADRAPELIGDPGTEPRSAVLVPLYENEGETWLVLTRRSPLMRSHTFEISFPGGKQDPEDPDEWATAIREAHEEVGLDPDLPRRIGALDRFITGGSQSLVHPMVAALPGPPVLRANEDEVDRILHVPLSELISPGVFREELWPVGDNPGRPVNFFELMGDTLWGATGTMVRQLLSLAAGIDDPLVR